MKVRTAIPAAAGFLACILAANYVTSHYGLIPVGFGLLTTAGTYFAGLSFVLRDSVQDGGGRWLAVGVIVAGAALSYLISDPFIATASGVAFLASETSDLIVYTPLREHGYVRAAVASNIVGTIVDTFLFLWIAGIGITSNVVAGQIVGKLTITAITIALVLLVRATRRPVIA